MAKETYTSKQAKNERAKENDKETLDEMYDVCDSSWKSRRPI